MCEYILFITLLDPRRPIGLTFFSFSQQKMPGGKVFLRNAAFVLRVCFAIFGIVCVPDLFLRIVSASSH